jgi:hypothetical protein
MNISITFFLTPSLFIFLADIHLFAASPGCVCARSFRGSLSIDLPQIDGLWLGVCGPAPCPWSPKKIEQVNGERGMQGTKYERFALGVVR